MANNTNNAINKNGSIKTNRALTYSEMMNEGIQSMTPGKQEQVDGLQERMQILDKKQNTFKTWSNPKFALTEGLNSQRKGPNLDIDQ